MAAQPYKQRVARSVALAGRANLSALRLSGCGLPASRQVRSSGSFHLNWLINCKKLQELIADLMLNTKNGSAGPRECV
jgi:hypothetical protein